MRRLSGLLLPLLLIGLTGCDSAVSGDDPIVLTAEVSTGADGSPIRFGFVADDVQVGRLTDITCGCDLDVADFLADRGFTKGDLISATVQGARLRMLFPIQEQIDFLDQAILKLRSSGNSVTEVAEQTTFPAAAEATLIPRQGRDVAGFVSASTFEPILQIDAGELLAGRDYEIGLVLTIRMELEAF